MLVSTIPRWVKVAASERGRFPAIQAGNPVRLSLVPHEGGEPFSQAFPAETYRADPSACWAQLLEDQARRGGR
jgi:hypothetical protein